MIKLSNDSKKWLIAVVKRAVRTSAQSAIALFGSAVVLSDIDFKVLVSASITAGILSVLTCIASGIPEAEKPKKEKIDGKY